jgi:hypothetical protein
MAVFSNKDGLDAETNMSEYGSEKEALENSTIHLSAMPTPLYAHRDSLEARFFAPPEDLLTHFDVMNSHVMHATNGLHDKIEAYHTELTQEMRQKHSDSICLLNEQFNEVYDRIRAVEHDIGRVVGTVTDTKETLSSKLETLAGTIQSDFVRRLDHLLFAHSEMARKVDNISLHLNDVHVKQQYMMEAVKGRIPSWQPQSTGSMDQNHAPVRPINTNMPINHAMQLATPHSPSPTFTCAETFINPVQMMSTNRTYTANGQHSVQPISHPPISTLLNSIYGGMRPNSSGHTYAFPVMTASDVDMPIDYSLSLSHGTDAVQSNGHAKNNVNGDGHEA